MRRQFGFTLTELLISIAILGLIAAFAIPSYQQAIRKSGRTDARVTMARLALIQERYFFQNNAYAPDMTALVGASAVNADGNLVSDEGHYVIAAAITGSTWELTATPVAGSSQADDEECQVFIQNGFGMKTARDLNSQDSPGCW